MAKKTKVYSEGDVLSVRLTEKIGTDKEVIDWINEQNVLSKSVIKAIKLSIQLEKLKSQQVLDGIANEIVEKSKSNADIELRVVREVEVKDKDKDNVIKIENNREPHDKVDATKRIANNSTTNTKKNNPMNKALRSINPPK